MTTQLFASLAWSGAGFALGWLTCWFALRAAEADARRYGVTNVKKVARMDVVRAILGVVLLLLVIMTSFRYYTATSCQTEYNQVIAEALILRSDSQKQEGLAQIELLTASLSGDREAALRETREYIAAITELEHVRLRSPLPSPPDCGGY